LTSGSDRHHLTRIARSIAAVLLLGWCVVASTSSARTAAPSGISPIVALDAEFAALARHLPARGEVGFLDRYVGAGEEDAVRAWFTAQYALAPRIVVSRTGPEFLIVARGAANPGGDERLNGYSMLQSVDGGHRLFRKVAE
jgi:hypothetical protein